MADDFLSGLEQSSVSFGDIDVKLPFAFRSGRILQAGFYAPVKKLKKIIPGNFPTPAQLIPGSGLVVLTVYEYNETDIGPFNEFSAVVPLNTPDFPSVPFYNLIKTTKAHKLHNFLLHRASDSETFVRLLKDYYRWPQFHASIEFSDGDDWLTCEVKENENLICRLRGPKVPVETSEVTEVYIYTQRNQKPQYAELNREYTSTLKSLNSELTLGSSHPIAKELSEVSKSLKPHFYNYCPSYQAIMFGPDQHAKPS